MSKSSNPYFVSFGCWNNGGCNLEGASKQTDLSRVMKTLNSLKTHHLLMSSPEQIFIAGDNYYPEKTKLKNGSKKKNI